MVGRKVSYYYVVLFFIISLSCMVGGCSSSPPDGVMRESLLKGTMFYYPAQEKSLEIDSYKITNSYTKNINGEPVNVYEVTFKMKLGPKGNASNFKSIDFEPNNNVFGLVKRGNSWYYIRLN